MKKNKSENNTNCNSVTPDTTMEKKIFEAAEDKSSKRRKNKGKSGVTDDAPFSTAEYIMVKPGYDDDEINTQES